MSTLAVLALGLIGGIHSSGALSPLGDTTTALLRVSGLQIVHRIRPVQGIVAVRLYLLGGTRQLDSETEGVEALLLRAAELDAGAAVARTGSRSILEFHPDWTVTGFVGLSRDLDLAWAGFARCITGPALASGSLSDAAIDRARQELLSAARRRYAEPDLRIGVLARRAVFEGHAYQLDPEGTEESLARISRHALEQYAQKQLVTSRMLLVVVGDVERSRLVSLVATTLGLLPHGDYQWSLPGPVPTRPGRWRVEHRELATNYILGLFTGPDASHSDYYAFQVATELLSARLAREVRGSQSLSYNVGAPFLSWAIPVGGLYASSSDPAQVYALMKQEVLWMRQADLHHFPLSRFLDQFVLDQLVQNLTAESQAEALGRAQLYFGDFREADQYLRRLRDVKPVEVDDAARRYIQHIQFAYLGDTTLMHGKW